MEPQAPPPGASGRSGGVIWCLLTAGFMVWLLFAVSVLALCRAAGRGDDLMGSR